MWSLYDTYSYKVIGKIKSALEQLYSIFYCVNYYTNKCSYVCGNMFTIDMLIVQKEVNDDKESDDYDDVENTHYTAPPEALGEVKHIKRIDYDYASSGPVAVRKFIIE